MPKEHREEKQIANALKRRFYDITEIVLTEGEIAVLLHDTSRFFVFDDSGFPQNHLNKVNEFAKSFSEYFKRQIQISLFYESEWYGQGKPELALLHSIYGPEDREELRKPKPEPTEVSQEEGDKYLNALFANYG